MRYPTIQHIRPIFVSTVWICLVICVCGLQAAADQWESFGAEDFTLGQQQGLEISPTGRLRLTSFAGSNLALRVTASSGKTNLRNDKAVTDSNAATEWDFGKDPQVAGRTIEIDLGGNRLVTQVRILPGTELGAESPEFFMRGYRIDLASEEAPDAYLTIAQNFLNQTPLIDTTADSTWVRYEEGEPVPVLGRFIRITVTRQELPNWVIVGDVEVYGTGFQARGEYLSPIHDTGRPVNVGAGFFAAESPPGTDLRLQFRAALEEGELPDWTELPFLQVEDGAVGVYFPLQDPARFVQYRVLFDTDDPFLTPHLERVKVEFDPRLLARSASGYIQPVEVNMGEEVLMTYRALLPREAGEFHSVDLLVLNRPGSLEGLLINGSEVPPHGYELIVPEGSLQVPDLALRLRPEYRITGFSDISLSFTTVFFRSSEEVGLFLGSTEEGYDPRNWQKVTPSVSRTAATTAVVYGILRELVPPSSVAIRPRVFRPKRGGGTRIEFDLSRIQEEVPVTVTIHDLTGRRLRTVVDHAPVTAGEISIPWDGFGDHGGVLLPGIYMCRIRVHAHEGKTLVRFLGIAY